MKVFYTYKAANQLRKLPYFAQKRIVEKMRFFAQQKNLLEFS